MSKTYSAKRRKGISKIITGAVAAKRSYYIKQRHKNGERVWRSVYPWYGVFIHEKNYRHYW